jgi:tRNA-modifying protein YgfZ
MSEVLVARIDRDLVIVSGPDATTFLQSLLSQDLDPVGVGASAHALLLQPQGKLVVDMRVLHRSDDEWWCVCERGFGPVLAAGLVRFRIRVQVAIEDRAGDFAALSVRGIDEIAAAGPLNGAPGAPGAPGVAVLPADWSIGPGVDLIGDPVAVDAALGALTASGATEIDGDAFEALRVEAGVPRQGYDVDETTIAQEAYLDRDAVSFTKGCFLGQELVCRIDTRGHVNRQLRRLRADAPMARGAVVVADGKDVGAVTTAAGNVALATIRRAVEPGSAVVVTMPGGDVDARVEAVLAD